MESVGRVRAESFGRPFWRGRWVEAPVSLAYAAIRLGFVSRVRPDVHHRPGTSLPMVCAGIITGIAAANKACQPGSCSGSHDARCVDNDLSRRLQRAANHVDSWRFDGSGWATSCDFAPLPAIGVGR